jgi:hypothetical protein
MISRSPFVEDRSSSGEISIPCTDKFFFDENDENEDEDIFNIKYN